MSEEFTAPLLRVHTASPREVLSSGRSAATTVTTDDDASPLQQQQQRSNEKDVHSSQYVKQTQAITTTTSNNNNSGGSSSSRNHANSLARNTTSAMTTRVPPASPPSVTVIPEHYRMSHRPEQAVLSLAQLRAVKELFEVYDFARSSVNPMNQSSHLKRERVRAISQAGQSKRGRGSVVLVGGGGGGGNSSAMATAGTSAHTVPKLTSIKKLRQEAERSGGMLAGAAAQAVLSASRASIQKLREEIDPDIALAPLSVRDKAQDERERRQNLFGLMQRRMQMTTREEAYSESEETVSCASHEAGMREGEDDADDADIEEGMTDNEHDEKKTVTGVQELDIRRADAAAAAAVPLTRQQPAQEGASHKQPQGRAQRKSRSPIVSYSSNADSAATGPETEYERRLRQDRRVLAEELKCMHEWRERAAQLQAEHGHASTATMMNASASSSLLPQQMHNSTGGGGSGGIVGGRRRSSLHEGTGQGSVGGSAEAAGRQTETGATAGAVVMPSSAGVPLDYFTRFIVAPLFSTIFPVQSEKPQEGEDGEERSEKKGGGAASANNTVTAAAAAGQGESSAAQSTPAQTPTTGFLPRRRSHRRAVRELFQKMDTNADGRVSWHEFADFVLQEGQKQLLAQEMQHAKVERQRSCRRQQQQPVRGTSPRDAARGADEAVKEADMAFVSPASSRSTSQARQNVPGSSSTNEDVHDSGSSPSRHSTPTSARSTNTQQAQQQQQQQSSNAESAADNNASVLHYAPSFAPEPTNCSPWQAQFPLVKHLYHELPIHRLVHSTRHQRYFTASEDGLVKMWRADMNLRNTHLSSTSANTGTTTTSSHNNSALHDAQRQGHGGATDVPTRSSMVHERNVLNTNTPITDMVLSPRSMGNAEVIAVAALDGTVTLLRTATGELVRTLLGVRVETAAQVAATASACGRNARAAMMQEEAEDKDSSSNAARKTRESTKEGKPYTTYVGSRCPLRTRLRSPASASRYSSSHGNNQQHALSVDTPAAKDNNSTRRGTSDEAEESRNVAAGCVLRVPYTVRAYHDDSIEIFFGRSNRYFQGLEVMAPTYEHLKRGVPAVCDALFTFGEFITPARSSNNNKPYNGNSSSSVSPRRAQVKEQEWYATSLALTQHTSSSRYDALASGAYLVLGFHSGLVQLYRLDTHWFSSTHFSSTRVQPACGRHVTWSAMCHGAAVTRIVVTEPAHLVLTASEDGRVAVRHLSRLDALLFMLGDGSLPRAIAAPHSRRGLTKGEAGMQLTSKSRGEEGDGLMKEAVGHTKRITCMCWLAEAHVLITGGMDHCLFYWTTRSARPSRRINLRDMQASIPALARLGACGYPIDLSCMQRPGDPACLLVLDQRRVIRFLHALTGQFAAVLVDTTSSSLALGDMLVARYDAQEDRLLLGGRCLRVWEMARDQTYSRDYAGHKQPVLFLGWSHALRLFVSADEDQIVTWALVVESRHAEALARMRRLQKLHQKQQRQLHDGANNGEDNEGEEDEDECGDDEMDMSSASLSPITGLPRVSARNALALVEGDGGHNARSDGHRTSPSSSSAASSSSSRSSSLSSSSSSSLVLSSLQGDDREGQPQPQGQQQQQPRQGVSWTTEWQPQRTANAPPTSPTQLRKDMKKGRLARRSLLTHLPELVLSQDRDVNVYNHSMWRSRTRLVRAWPITAGVRAVAMNEQDHVSPGIFVALLREDAIVQYNGFNGAALRRFRFAGGAQDLLGLCAAEAANAARANQLHRSLNARAASVVSSSLAASTAQPGHAGAGQSTTNTALSLSHSSSGAGSSHLAMSCAPVLLAAYEEGGRSGLASVYPLLLSQGEAGSSPAGHEADTTTTATTTTTPNTGSATADPLRRPHRTVRVRESVVASVTVVPALDALVCGGRGRLYVTPVNGLTNVAAPCRTLPEQAAALRADANGSSSNNNKGMLAANRSSVLKLGNAEEGARRASLQPALQAPMTASDNNNNVSSDEDASALDLVALFPGHLVHLPRGVNKREKKEASSDAGREAAGAEQDFFHAAQAATAGYIGHLCPVPQTTYVISGSNDGLIQVWNIHTYAELLRFRVTLCDGDTITALHLHHMPQNSNTSSFARGVSRGPAQHTARSPNMPNNASLSAFPHAAQQQRSTTSYEGFAAFGAGHTGDGVMDGEEDEEGPLWSCEGQRHRYALAVGDASGYMTLLDLSHIPWEGGVALDVLPLERLARQVVLLDRWRAHRQDIRAIRLVNSPEIVGMPRSMRALLEGSAEHTTTVNASHTPYSSNRAAHSARVPREADEDAAGGRAVKPYDEPLTRPSTQAVTSSASAQVSAALLSSVLTIVTASEDSYIYVWRWERGLLHCLGCMGGGRESLVSPPLRQPMAHALTLFAQAREHYLWHRLICEQGFFLTAPLPHTASAGRAELRGRFGRHSVGPCRLRHRLRAWEVDAAVEFMSREVHQLVSTNAVWQLATWGSLCCRSLAEEAERRARRYARQLALVSDARRVSTVRSGSVLSKDTSSVTGHRRWRRASEKRSGQLSSGHRNSSNGSSSVRSLPRRSRSQLARRASSCSSSSPCAEHAAACRVFDDAGLPYLHWTSHSAAAATLMRTADESEEEDEQEDEKKSGQAWHASSSSASQATPSAMMMRRGSTASSNNSEGGASVLKHHPHHHHHPRNQHPQRHSPSPTAPAGATAVVWPSTSHYPTASSAQEENNNKAVLLSASSPYVFAFMSGYHGEDSVRACLQHTLEQLYPTLRQRVKEEVNSRNSNTTTTAAAALQSATSVHAEHIPTRSSSVSLTPPPPPSQQQQQQTVQAAVPVSEAAVKSEQAGTPQHDVAQRVQEQLQGTMRGTDYGIEHTLRPLTPHAAHDMTTSRDDAAQNTAAPLPAREGHAAADQTRLSSSPSKQPQQHPLPTQAASHRHGSFVSASSWLPHTASLSRITADHHTDTTHTTAMLATTRHPTENNQTEEGSEYTNGVVSSVCSSTSVSQLADTNHPRSLYGASTNSTRPASGPHSMHDPLHSTQRPLNSTSVSLLVSTAQGEESSRHEGITTATATANDDDDVHAMTLAQPMQGNTDGSNSSSPPLIARTTPQATPFAPAAAAPAALAAVTATRQSSTDSDNYPSAMSPAARCAALAQGAAPSFAPHEAAAANVAPEPTFSNYRVAYDTNLPLVRVSSANKTVTSTTNTTPPHSAGAAHGTRLPSIISASALRRSRHESSRAASARRSLRSRSATGANAAVSSPASRRGTAFARPASTTTGGGGAAVEATTRPESKAEENMKEEDDMESDLASRKGAAAVMHMAYLHRKREEALQRLAVMHNALTSNTGGGGSNNKRRSPSWLALQQEQKNKLEAVLEAGVLGLATYKDFSDTGTSTVFFGAERALLEVRRGRRARVSESFLRRVFSREGQKDAAGKDEDGKKMMMPQAKDSEEGEKAEASDDESASEHSHTDEDAHDNEHDVVKLDAVEDWYSAREKQRCRRRRDEALWNSERVMRTLMDWQAPLPDAPPPALLPALVPNGETTTTTVVAAIPNAGVMSCTTPNESSHDEAVANGEANPPLPSQPLAALQALRAEELQWMMNSTLNATLTEAVLQSRAAAPVWQLPDFLPLTLTPSEPLVQPTLGGVLPAVLPPIAEHITTETTKNNEEGGESKAAEDEEGEVDKIDNNNNSSAVMQPVPRAGQTWRLYMAAQNYADSHAAQNPQHRITALVAAQVEQIEGEMHEAMRANAMTIARRMSLSTTSNANSEATGMSYANQAGRQLRLAHTRSRHAAASNSASHTWQPGSSSGGGGGKRADEEKEENSRSTPSILDETMQKRHAGRAVQVPWSHSALVHSASSSSQAANNVSAAAVAGATTTSGNVRTLQLSELRRTRLRQPPAATAQR